MSRLTAEREQEIREKHKEEHLGRNVNDLLAEIDALREECNGWQNRSLTMERERDQLKAENEKLRLFLNPMTDESIRLKKENQKLREHNKQWADDLHNVEKERNQLKAENEKLKMNQLFETSCTYLFEENQKLKVENESNLRLIKDMEHHLWLSAEVNNKLRERIAKLDLALSYCKIEILNWTHDDIITDCDILITLFCDQIKAIEQALAQDDEMEKRG